jgi:hypothetical protein
MSGGILTALRLVVRVSELFVFEEIWKSEKDLFGSGRSCVKK